MQTKTLRPSAFRPEWLVLLAGLIFCISQLAISFSNPIVDQYSFRQTQTAISVYWILKGGSWLAYQTPVIGSPWSIPFEFPLYQWVVAVVAKALPFLSLDESGRIVSEIFFLSMLWPMWRIASHQERNRTLFSICGGFLMLSPIYAFWSRAFMMESMTLFFSMWFVAALIDFLIAPSLIGFIEIALTATLAAIIKITTFVGFSFAGALIVLYFAYKDVWGGEKTRQNIIKYIGAALSIAIAVLMLWIWVRYSDGLKSANLIGRFYTGTALKTWNFGTFAQRKSLALLKVIVDRAPAEAAGSWLVVAIATALAIAKLTRSQLLIYFSLLGLYAAPFFVFTNLHLVHHYYQYANSIFLVLGIGYVAYALQPTAPLVAYFFMSLIFLGQIYGCWKYFYQDLTLPNRQTQMLLADYLRQNTDPKDVFVGFGLDWSSEVPYYAERRALLIPDTATGDMLDQIASNPLSFTGKSSIGAVVICPNKLSASPQEAFSYSRLLHSVTTNLTPRIVGICEVYSPRQSTSLTQRS
jgi:hypothetical protein